MIGARSPLLGTLRAAVRQVAAAYSRLPAAAQARLDLAADPLEREVDAAVLAGDDDRAREAIDAWRDGWLHRCEQATEQARRLILAGAYPEPDSGRSDPDPLAGSLCDADCSADVNQTGTRDA